MPTWKKILLDGDAAPTDADYLVGTANAGLSAEIVVGTTPGGELGGTWASPTLDSIEHDRHTGLTDDDHTQYALLAGRSGGQTLIGGTASGDDLTLKSTSHATKGTIFLGTLSAYDEVNDRLGLGTTAPTATLSVSKTVSTGGVLTFDGVLDTPHTGDTGDSLVVANMSLTANSATNELVIRAQHFKLTNALTGGGQIQNLRAFNIALITAASTSTDQAAAIFIEQEGATATTTTIKGIHISSLGLTNTTNAIGIHIDAQANATNNYDMSFGRVDTTAAGAYYGRVPILYNGLLKYLHVFSA